MANRILIVDDSAVDRSILKAILEKNLNNIEILELDSADRVYEVLEHSAIKVCILDLRMPGVDGFEVLKKIKMNPQTMDLPVIVCSGLMSEEALESVLSLGAFDYFTKPLSQEVMKIALPLKVRNAVELSTRTQYIVKLAQTDALTGLYNREYMRQLGERLQLSPNENAALIMMDINGLKVINDAYGNEGGDESLKRLGEIIKQQLPVGGLGCRWGGDEFLIFLKNIDQADVKGIKNEIKQSFEQFQFQGLSLTLSCGSDFVVGNTSSFHKMIVNAEDAMFRDKVLEDVSVRSGMINTILNTLHEKNPREEAHSRRVSELCVKMGEALGLGNEDLKALKLLGLVHDIGKIGIDESILNKPGHLDHAEWHEMKRHPEIGYRLLSSSSEMVPYAEYILRHHERIDGKGYPGGLTDNEIPFFSKILSIADSFDAMTYKRTYRQVLSDADACLEILHCAGKQFDPMLAELFVYKVMGFIQKEEVQ